MYPILYLALCVAFLPNYAFAADSIHNNTVSASLSMKSQALENSPYHCNTKLFPRNYVRYRVCSMAIDELSDSNVPGDFHSGLPNDDYQLPREEESGFQCAVRVKIRQRAGEGAVERSTWREIAREAKALIRFCSVVDPTFRVLMTLTGWTTVGLGGRIKVRIFSPGPYTEAGIDEEEDDKWNRTVAID